MSDLHLGPGTTDPRFTGIEDFYSDREWGEFLAREGARGPTDVIIAGDFIELWQIASAMHALPRPGASDSRADTRTRPGDANTRPDGPVLGADRAFSESAIALVIAAHPSVFRAMARFLDGGDHRVIIIPGNHDADLLWPSVQLAIARAVNPRDLSRLVFSDAVAYVHGGVYVAHGHALDAANRFATQHAPFGRDSSGRCRLQSNWGEVFVDLFYTETERQLPFIDNLYPEKAAILWAVRDNPDLARDLGAAVRAIDLLRAAQKGGLNRDALGAILQSATGITGTRGPESTREVLDHVGDRLSHGDRDAENLVAGLMELATDPDLRSLRSGLTAAASALPDVRAALSAIRTIDPAQLATLQSRLFGDAAENSVEDMFEDHEVDAVVLGHTHTVGGFVKKLRGYGYYANTGSWISVASVADLKAKGIGFDQLSLANRTMFPSRMTAIVIEYRDGAPLAPSVVNAH